MYEVKILLTLIFYIKNLKHLKSRKYNEPLHTKSPASTIVKILDNSSVFLFFLMKYFKANQNTCHFTLNISVCILAKYGHFLIYHTDVTPMKKQNSIE